MLFNPFYKAHASNLSFVTYTLVGNAPNGINNFKFRLTNPMNELMHETSINAVEVKDNTFFNVMIWNNLPLTMPGEHTLTLYLAIDNDFEPAGSTIIIITDPNQEG
ncbi:MAG: hypothetical protein Q8942_17205 [Bacillota bacterium]|nr:hypothetical protein [Bacillota bacterium]